MSYSHHNFFKYPRTLRRRETSLFLMMCIFNVVLNFSSAPSIKYSFVFFVIMIFIWFSNRINSLFYITRHMIICIDSKRIKPLSIKEIVKSTSGFIKPTVFIIFIIITLFNWKLLGTIHFSPSNTTLLIYIVYYCH